MSSPLPEDIKKGITEIADRRGWTVPDPGTVFKNKDGEIWVFVVDKASDMPLWVLLD